MKNYIITYINEFDDVNTVRRTSVSQVAEWLANFTSNENYADCTLVSVVACK